MRGRQGQCPKKQIKPQDIYRSVLCYITYEEAALFTRCEVGETNGLENEIKT